MATTLLKKFVCWISMRTIYILYSKHVNRPEIIIEFILFRTNPIEKTVIKTVLSLEKNGCYNCFIKWNRFISYLVMGNELELLLIECGAGQQMQTLV